ncbi:peptidase inhibitor 16-like [Mizuhopecten yessoensis]|nr:peptidase inhibitor 16-like [Mizuhopecten yessoensis]
MQAMTWSRSLKNNAADWADECLWKHSSYSDRTVPWKGQSTAAYVGENLFMTTAKTLNITKIVNSWYVEKNDYNIITGSCTSGKECGHYTQVVWSKSDKLGCSMERCQPLRKIEDGKKVVMKSLAWLVVCQYGPGGNVGSTKPYVRGTRCSGCPSHTTCDSSRKLCVISDRRRELELLLDALYPDFEENSNGD